MTNRFYTDGSPPDLCDLAVVTAEQMQRIETVLFDAGMPVAALMEKVAGRIARWIIERYPRDRTSKVGFIVGPGHNGGDALVVARELHHQGYQVHLWCPFSQVKTLTRQHSTYLEYLGISCDPLEDNLDSYDLIVDGGFGFGLTRPLSGEIATGITSINNSSVPVVSIDLPSGLETDSGNVLGIAIQADQTLCLGLWKLGLLQDRALPYVGEPHLIPFDIPTAAIQPVLAHSPSVQRITSETAIAHLPLPRSPIAHKYTIGHLLLIAGSRQYAGAALLAGKGAIASGIGMLTLIVPAGLKDTVVSQIPEALVIAAPETETGAIARLPDALEWDDYDGVACGPGMTPQAEVIEAIMECDRPLVLDADALNWLSQNDPQQRLTQRSAPTLLTPHPGEFRRLFPDIWQEATIPGKAAQQAAQAAHCTVILKGAISAIAHLDGQLWFNPNSTAALARGGSGDVLTGLVAGLAAQHYRRDPEGGDQLLIAAIAAVWWHAHAGRWLAARQTVLGCPPGQLVEALSPALAEALTQPKPGH
ncbi:NAD(P)H-hydrate dehydratase [Oscillatoria sp. CS-180]|uniref:NAD(P)H-hydrate dehydratase n=1 Tax=Oscillatoria sp. CS-180 TaxID=3021720 RepID=UPI00232EE3BE|nr:NAD(P)H-hydrate dehydratase [Oscillatoria sp. CS-180]MDB9525463.1 NAD(P)H-hydrate dehydratase [Oscillatoria sp. CS-180]